MNSRSIRTLLSGLLVALVTSAVFAGSATALPVWKFSGASLEGTELTVGFGVKSSLTVPGAPVTCEHFLYKMVLSNSAGTGKAEVTELPLFECTTSAAECTIEAIGAEKLPWPAHLMAGKSGNYVVIEGVRIGVLYGGELCALNEVEATITGTAGALFDNTSEAAIFNAASFSETKTDLKTFGSSLRLEGVFPTEAFEWHRGEALSVS